MRGQWDYCYDYQCHTVYFSFDEIQVSSGLKEALIIEHKMPSAFIQDEKVYEASVEKYLAKSASQAALFQSLFHFSSKRLTPSSFSKETTDLDLSDSKVSFKLNFGDQPFDVQVMNPDMVMRFYLTKLRAAFHWVESARFDESWKDREWEFMKGHVKVRRQ